MNSRKSLYDVKSFYSKRAVLKAGFEGMRYQVEMLEAEEEQMLRVSVWPEPFCFEKTADDKKQIQDFPCSEKGLDMAYQWLCDSYEKGRAYWEHARDFPLDGLGREM